MHSSEDPNSRSVMERLAGSLLLLSFGCAMLAYLIAIERPEWFSLRPVSGAAAAMSNAAQPHHQEDITDDSKAPVRKAMATPPGNPS